MPGRGWDAGKAAERARKSSEKAVNRSAREADLPPHAVERLTEQAANQGGPNALFTSDLSVNELALVCDSGYQPLGQVMGSSIFQVGLASGVSAASGELQSLTRAFYSARHLCLGRLQQEAALLGATAVTGIRLEHKMLDWAPDLIEFQAFGTAMRIRGTHAPAGNTPALSSLTGQETWLLDAAGYRPVGIAVGNCTWFQIMTQRDLQASQPGPGGRTRNKELTDFTRSLYKARSMAMSRMEGEAGAVKADGVVGVVVDVEVRPAGGESARGERMNLLYHFTAIGTAVQSIPGIHIHPAIEAVISLQAPHQRPPIPVPQPKRRR